MEFHTGSIVIDLLAGELPILSVVLYREGLALKQAYIAQEVGSGIQYRSGTDNPVVVSVRSKDGTVCLRLGVLNPLALVNKDTPEDAAYRVGILVGHIVDGIILLALDCLVDLRGKLIVLLI